MTQAEVTPEVEKGSYPTRWARTPPMRGLREIVQVVGLKNLLRKELDLDVQGADDLAQFEGPALIISNHSSHLDTGVLLATLPNARRRRTAVAAAADYFFGTWWRAAGSAIAFNTFPIERRGGARLSTPARLLADGWSVIVYPEGTRSRDGFLGRFRLGAAWMAVEYQVPVIPVGIRGTYAAMPRNSRWIVRGRPRVNVRYGTPIMPGSEETPREFAPKLSAAVRALIVEDETSWWRTQHPFDSGVIEPTPGSWRRIWQQTEAPVEGGRSRHRTIWRT